MKNDGENNDSKRQTKHKKIKTDMYIKPTPNPPIMIKSAIRIWFYIYSIFCFSIGIFVLTKGKYNADSSVFSILVILIFFSLVTFGVPIWSATKLKTIIIDNNGIKITFPFLQKNLLYLYSDIDYFETYEGVALWFSSQEMKIVFKNNETLIITSNANTRFKEMDVFLRQKIEKKNSGGSE